MASANEERTSEGSEKNEERPWLRPETQVWLITATITAIVITVAGVIYYQKVSGWNSARETHYANLASHLAEETELRISSYRSVAGVIGDAAKRFVELDRSADRASQQADATSPRLSFERVDCSQGEPTPTGEALERCRAASVAQVVLGRAPQASIRDCSVDAGVRVLLDGQTVLFPIPRDAEAGQPARRAILCLSIPLGELLSLRAPVANPDADDFDEVVLAASAQRRVLAASHGDPRIRVTTVPALEKPDPARPDLPAAVIGSARYFVLQAPLAIDVDAPACASDKQAPCGPNLALEYVGFVHEGRFHNEARAFSPIVFLWLVVFAAFAIFSWPLAKLFLVGPRSSYTRNDARFVAVAALVGTFVLVLVFLATLGDLRFTRREYARLRWVSETVSSALDAKLATAKAELENFVVDTKTVRKELFETGTEPVRAAGWTCVDWKHADQQQRRACERLAAVPGEPVSTPGRDLAFWMNPDGYEQLQQSARPSGTPPVHLARRSYFRAAKERCGTDGHDVVEVVRSMLSTRKLLIVARPTCDTATAWGVAAIETDIAPFINLRFPQSLQWAAIDGDGRIMLHSQLSEHHGHNLFADFDADTKEYVRAAMQAKTGEAFKGVYRGIRSQLRIHHHTPSGWFIVAIASRAGNEAVRARSLLTTAVAMGVVALAVVLAIALASWLRKRGDGARSPLAFQLQPRANRRVGYYRATLFMLACSMLVTLLTVLGAAPWTTLLVGGAVVALVVGVFRVPGVYSTEGQSETVGDDASSSLRYATCLTVFVGAAVVVPTVVCFVSAFSVAAERVLLRDLRAAGEVVRCHSVHGSVADAPKGSTPDPTSLCGALDPALRLDAFPKAKVGTGPSEGTGESRGTERREPPWDVAGTLLWPTTRLMGLMFADVAWSTPRSA